MSKPKLRWSKAVKIGRLGPQDSHLLLTDSGKLPAHTGNLPCSYRQKV